MSEKELDLQNGDYIWYSKCGENPPQDLYYVHRFDKRIFIERLISYGKIVNYPYWDQLPEFFEKFPDQILKVSPEEVTIYLLKW